MSQERAPEEPPPPPAKVPTTFGFELTLGPDSTETVTFHGDQDVVLHAMSAKADGPAVVETRVTDTPPAGKPVISIPGGTLTEYLERELPAHLAAAAGEELSAWAERNRVLMAAALSGDDEAFFELLARDPRQLASQLTVARAVTWRTEIEYYNRFFRFKASRFVAPAAAVIDAQRQMEQARENLARLGASQLDLYDQRGKRPLPPPYVVRGFYYGLLCLLQGLRGLAAQKQHAGVLSRRVPRGHRPSSRMSGSRSTSCTTGRFAPTPGLPTSRSPNSSGPVTLPRRIRPACSPPPPWKSVRTPSSGSRPCPRRSPCLPRPMSSGGSSGPSATSSWTSPRCKPSSPA